jgi:hypothetical protein
MPPQLSGATQRGLFFTTLIRFRDCRSKRPVRPRIVLNRRFTTRPKIMIRILGHVDEFGDNGAPISGR